MFLSCGGLAETDDETEFVGQLELALKENQGNLHALAKLLNTVMDYDRWDMKIDRKHQSVPILI